MKVQTLGTNLLVKPKEKESTTKGGIILTANKQKEGMFGVVEYMGKDVDIPIDVGDQILFGEYVGDDIEIEGEEYKIIDEDDVLAVITK